MMVSCKFELEQKVRHRLTEFEGFITGIVIRGHGVEYEVQPVTDDNANWRESKWLPEIYLQGESPDGKK
jgi:heat shock protein HspQ